jgi:hypothetical protein
LMLFFNQKIKKSKKGHRLLKRPPLACNPASFVLQSGLDCVPTEPCLHPIGAQIWLIWLTAGDTLVEQQLCLHLRQR